MPRFFIPGFEKPEDAIGVYDRLPTGQRLFSIGFRDRGRTMVAKVGKEIDGFRERAGFVLAIIETTTVVQVVTVRRTIDNPVRRHRDFTILSGVRARAATLPFTIIIFAKIGAS